MKILLYRVAQFGREGTISLADLGDERRQFWIELPDRGNAPRISRIPAGTYRLVPHSEGRFAPTWALEGDGVAHVWRPGCERSAILIHAANRARELLGCLAPGQSVGFLQGELAVLNSRAALAELLGLLDPGEEHEIEILETPGGWGAL